MVGEGRDAGRNNILDDLAYSTYLTRRLRSDIFGPDLFGEPAWDILLLLYSNADHSGQLSVRDISRELRLSESVIARWIAILVSYDLAVFQSDRAALSDNGRDKLKTYLKRQIESLMQMLQSISAPSDSGRGAA